jgi:hypothetical protein
MQLRQGFIAVSSAADHQVIGIIDDVRSEAFSIPKMSPSQNEPPHVRLPRLALR